MGRVNQYSMESQSGCGLMGVFFHRRILQSQRTSVYSLSTETSNNTLKISKFDYLKKLPVANSKQQRAKTETSFVHSSKLSKSSPKVDPKHTGRRNLVSPTPPKSKLKNEDRRVSVSDVARSSASSSSSSAQNRVCQPNGGKPRKDSINRSRELVPIVATSQKTIDGKPVLRPTSGNVWLLGHLGNLSQRGNGNVTGNKSPTTSAPRASKDLPKFGGNGLMGNIMRQPSGEFTQSQYMMNTTDPEALKNMGNEKYKQGRFSEALALYDRSIALDSSKATYRSNKSAALIGLGRLIDAVTECNEAIRIDPSYKRAHYRLGTLYFRLGEADKALYHYKNSGASADCKEVAQAQALQKHLKGCAEAKKLKDWNILLKKTECAISTGADSAPQVQSMQAEALLRLLRHEDAYATYQKGSKFCIDSITKLFGQTCSCHLLITGAEVYLAAGRFDDAVTLIQQAERLDPTNREVSSVAKKTKAVASARLSGNLLFKASEFSKACVAYSEGLELEPHNSILLCNRAACRSKLGQYEKAVEDCTIALRLQPNYTKARRRRADSNAMLERWKASIQDYEMLIRDTPADEELSWALFQAQVQIKKQRGEDAKDLKLGSNVVSVSRNERFRHFVISPGMTVVLFCTKKNHMQELQLMEHLCKKFQSVNFLKVEAEHHPYLAKSEGLTSLPCFKIYKNGSQVADIVANNEHSLEKLIKLYSS
ncbi:hypothetical protein K2173_026804 [Erythroxylum novogranatense]|uniref:Thioredoxin domain-containing protein n=1 Tax=Erythroxylum novogranatense TaxID=1862640 RepID=A0AAV8TX89_9ROSI|nr:hypothetical protein K2173_026804 [Erythroxylum novogranatense]